MKKTFYFYSLSEAEASTGIFMTICMTGAGQLTDAIRRPGKLKCCSTENGGLVRDESRGGGARGEEATMDGIVPYCM
jgi:hypothetical protein